LEAKQEALDQATELLWTYSNDKLGMAIDGTTSAMKLKMAW